MDIDLRLQNWGRCVREVPHFGHCFSIEYRYKAPPQPPMSVVLAEWLYERGMCSAKDVQDAYQSRTMARYEAPDRRDGETIEKAWRTVPNKSCKAILKLWYVKRRQPAYIARRLRVDFDRELMMGQAAIEIELLKTVPHSAFYSAKLPINTWSNQSTFCTALTGA